MSPGPWHATTVLVGFTSTMYHIHPGRFEKRPYPLRPYPPRPGDIAPSRQNAASIPDFSFLIPDS